LAVLNWSPVQWKDRLGHYTLKIYWPATVSSAEVKAEELARLKLRTEKFMNASYKIDYFGTERNGKHWLTQRIHWEGVPPQGHFRVQEYVDAGLFNQVGMVELPEPAPPQPRPGETRPGSSPPPKWEQPPRPPAGVRTSRQPLPAGARRGAEEKVYLFLLVGLLVVVFFLVIAAKHRSMLAAADGLKEVSWLEADWSPPQIVLSSFRKTGKIPELEPIEAAVLLGIPFNRILSIMLGAMQRKGAVGLHDDGRIDVWNRSANLNAYELALLDCLGLDGKLAQDKLRQWIQRLVDTVQRKSWDADVEATQKHYSEEFGAVFSAASPQAQGEGRPGEAPPSRLPDDDYYPYYFSWVHSEPRAPMPDLVPAVFSEQTLREAAAPADDYQSFMASPACYEGCFVHSACHDACHSACHDACHDACHSACHDACHSACHDACVSGDAH
jgi:hypothetical protein